MKIRVFAPYLLAVLLASHSFADSSTPDDLASLQARADKGDAEAQLDLGRDYHTGKGGVAVDYAKATDYYEKAAAQGNAKAMFNLGYIYRHGQGIAQDNDLANQWYQKAADHGLAAGQLEIGRAYYSGDVGLKKDYAAAAKWLTLAAKQTDSPAQSAPAANLLGLLYEYGWGVPQDGKQAAVWYGQAAEMGNADGQANTGRLDYEGLLVKRDRIEGYKWLKLAAAQGQTMAVHAMSEYMSAKTFTPEEIAEGDKRADEFQATHHRARIRTIPFVNEPGFKGPVPSGMTLMSNAPASSVPAAAVKPAAAATVPAAVEAPAGH